MNFDGIDNFYNGVKEILEEARNKAYSSINFYMVQAYWNIGRMIVEEQKSKEKAEYGQYILKELSKKLTRDYGKGFDYSNLNKLYLSFNNIGALRQQLSWTHYMSSELAELFAKPHHLEEEIRKNLGGIGYEF
jgi:hypothetical protein